ncbi:hypothetical protein Hanom_Chr07g00668521 [Helianthus anomalus]
MSRTASGEGWPKERETVEKRMSNNIVFILGAYMGRIDEKDHFTPDLGLYA